MDLNKEEIIHQINRINIFLVLSLSLLIFINVLHFYSLVAYSEPVASESEEKKNDDIISTIFSNSVTQMLMSTAIIAVVGVLITKLRDFRKKLDMIEVLTKALVKFQKQADQREATFNKILEKHTEETERKIEYLEKKIEEVKDEATSALIKYLSENAVDRKR